MHVYGRSTHRARRALAITCKRHVSESAIAAQTRARAGARAHRAHTHIYKNEEDEEVGRGGRIRLYECYAIQCFEFGNKRKTSLSQ